MVNFMFDVFHHNEKIIWWKLQNELRVFFLYRVTMEGTETSPYNTNTFLVMGVSVVHSWVQVHVRLHRYFWVFVDHRV